MSACASSAGSSDSLYRHWREGGIERTLRHGMAKELFFLLSYPSFSKGACLWNRGWGV